MTEQTYIRDWQEINTFQAILQAVETESGQDTIIDILKNESMVSEQTNLVLDAMLAMADD